MTPRRPIGSRFLGVASLVILQGCSTAVADPAPAAKTPQACLGVADKGVFPDLDDRVLLTLPSGVTAAQVTAVVDRERALVVLSIDGHPYKVYPLGGEATLTVGTITLALRPGDRNELRPLLAAPRVREGRATPDRDGDGIPDPLDLLIGAKKAALNAAAYTAEAQGYIKLRYPGGDVPRTIGVCTDVVIRAARNAGLDLQQAVHEDIKRRGAAFPMIKKHKGPDANIDHRRVGTLLPYFKKHWQARSAAIDDAGDPLRPGDVIFMDTFPRRPGPDHIGIVSDRIGPSGLPLVINNWTNGTVTAEMDLLSFVPVLYRFRMAP
jgi:uncharacterized protein